MIEMKEAKKKAVKINSYSNTYFYPKQTNGLEELVIFPDGEVKRKGIPDSSVWVYNIDSHNYNPEILGPDVGCGIAGFKVPVLDYKEAADIVVEYLKGKNILGRGNHFVDLCDSIISQYSKEDPDHSIILLHSDGKKVNSSVPTNLEEARVKISDAEKFREELGYKIADILGVNADSLGNWTHNSVEIENDKVVYRKGAVKTEHGKMYILPSNLCKSVFVYTVHEEFLPPYSSMPHGTGRRGPLSEFKVTEEKAREIRDVIYVPDVISDASLKSEHPDCYNSTSKIFKALHEHIVGLGDILIRSYIGKI